MLLGRPLWLTEGLFWFKWNWRECPPTKPGSGQLRDNLRIADGSIMPRVTTGNTMAACVIIGEHAAEALRKEHKPVMSPVSHSVHV